MGLQVGRPASQQCSWALLKRPGSSRPPSAACLLRCAEPVSCVIPAAPPQEVYMNKELLQKLRGSNGTGSGAGSGAGAAPLQQAAAAAIKPHQHFRPRPASEAPSQRQQGPPAAAAATASAAAAPASRPAQHQQKPPPAPQQQGRAAAPLQRAGGSGAASGAASRPAGRPVATDIDSLFLPRKPGLQRPVPGGPGVRAAARYYACCACLPSCPATCLPWLLFLASTH